ncbi:endomembrane protein 70 [Botrytis cinerea]
MRLKDLRPSAALIATFLVAPELSSAFYLPGVAPTSYSPGAKVPLFVNRLTPVGSYDDGQLRSVVSFDYYHPAFHFCRPDPKPEYVSESLGSILFGDRIMTSPFNLKMGVNETCTQLCEEKKFDQSSAHFVNRRIQQGFALNWIRIGSSDQKDMHLNNHYDIFIDYHEVSAGQMRVVGVIVQPSSRTMNENPGDPECGAGGPKVVLSESGETAVTYSYSVWWQPSTTAWATRWDKYLHVFDPKIHWFSLINSAVIVVFLVITVLSILMRTLRKDIQRYNRLDSINLDDLSGTSVAVEDGVQEDSGWKLVHGDVFRTPGRPLILSVFLGNGAQLFVMTGFTIAFALLGFLSPSNRGSLGTIMILLYTVLGFIGGYTSARVYKSFGGEQWKLNIALTPTLVPGIVFSTFFLLNLFLWAKESSGAVPFTTMLVIVAIWFFFSLPLSFAGSWVGFRQPPIASPVRTNQIPRQIPPSTSENYHWHWRAFMTAGASAGYVFANAMIYWVTKLQLGGLAGSVLYIGYSALISFLFFILTGSIGYFACWAFVQKIYGSIKID